MKKTPTKIPVYGNQAEFEKNMPQMVDIITTEDGTKVFVVGTMHFSLKSQDNVSVVIRNTKPSVILLELCPQRKHMLEIDEETLLREASTLTASKIRKLIANKGLVNGIFYLYLLKTYADSTKRLGVAPGGEMRRAVQEGKLLQNCKVVLGDRPIDITIQRALKPLTFSQKLQLYKLLSGLNTKELTPANVDDFESRDDESLKSIENDFPSIYRSFVTERDKILAHNLMLASKLTGSDRKNVVGVVGMGHMNGILENFGKTTAEEIKKIMRKDTEQPKPPLNLFQLFTKFVKFLKHK